MEDRVREILSKYSIIASELANVNANIANMSTSIDRLSEAINNLEKPHSAPQTMPRRDMPTLGIFYGRQEDVDEVAKLLANPSTSRVCITGTGGMGKTSVALAVIETDTIRNIFRPGYLFWVPCVEAKSADMLRRLLYTQLRITAQSYDSLDTLIGELGASTDRRLLLLDNLETPLFSGDEAQVKDILLQLAKLPHVAILITMTSAFSPSYDIDWQNKNLESLDTEAARETFKSVYPNVAEENLDELLKAVGHIPMAVHLMAIIGQRSRASPTYLLQQWGTSGTDMLAPVDHSIGLAIGREGMTDQALELFATLSMLPAGTTGENLAWWAPSLAPHLSAIEILRARELIEQGEGEFPTSHIFVRPTIQAYMSRKDRISEKVQHQVHDACYKFVLSHKSTPDNVTFKSDLKALEKEQTNIQGLLMQIDVQNLRESALEALITFSLYQAVTKPSPLLAQYALEVALGAKDDFRIAEAHECLGKTFHLLDCYDDACRHFEDARHRFENLPGGYDLNIHRAGECAMQLARTWMYMGYEAIGGRLRLEELVLKAQAQLSHGGSDKIKVARGHLIHGYFLWFSWAEDSEVFAAFSAAKSICDSVPQAEYPASTSSESIYWIAKIHGRSENYAEALRIAEGALEVANQCGEVDMLSRILLIVVTYLVILRRYRDALDIIERQALPMTLALGRPLWIGRILERVGYAHAAKGNLPAAREAYEQARQQYTKIPFEFTGQDDVDRCLLNLEKLGGDEVMGHDDIDWDGLSDLDRFPSY
jgi:tetratricopeptide (TPR) repeat protein